MVDLRKELDDFENGSYEQVMKNLEIEKENLNKKMQVLKVFEAEKLLDKLVEDKVFKKAKISQLILSTNYDEDFGDVFYFKLLYDESKENKEVKSFTKIYQTVNKIMRLIDLDEKYRNENFRDNKEFSIELNRNGIKKLKEIVLINELIKSVSYWDLNKSLDDKSKYKRTKIKI